MEKIYIARDLRAVRNKLGFTQVEFAQAMGLSIRSVAAMESHDTPIDKRTYMAASYLLLSKHLKELSVFIKPLNALDR